MGLSFYNGFIKTRFTRWKERSGEFSNIKGIPEDVRKNLLSMIYDFEFPVEDINTVTSNCFIILISKYLFSVKDMKSITMKIIISL